MHGPEDSNIIPRPKAAAVPIYPLYQTIKSQTVLLGYHCTYSKVAARKYPLLMDKLGLRRPPAVGLYYYPPGRACKLTSSGD